jgi:hypothetical protein
MKRREFIKSGLLTTVAAGVISGAALADPAKRAVAGDGCRVVQSGVAVELDAPAFNFKLNTSKSLWARSWQNKLSGRTIFFGPFDAGSELEVDLDTAEARIQIPGWKGIVSPGTTADCNQERGYLQGYHQPGFDDSKWRGTINLTVGEESPTTFTWARTSVAIPASEEGKPISLTLGGFGLLDHRFMRVFLNGHEVGARRVSGRWHEPSIVDLGPESAAHNFVKYGQENLIAVQLNEFVTRPAHLDELDPLHGRNIPGSLSWPFSPAHFEQYLTVGPLPETIKWGPARLASKKEGLSGEAVFELTSDDRWFSALVTYRWTAQDSVLHKHAEIAKHRAKSVRIMDVRLGKYQTGAPVSDGEQGFPVYLEGDFFMGLAHPYGWATGDDGRVTLRQYPGTKLDSGETFKCMEAVYGVAPSGQARKSFLSHLQGRMRRVVRGHDRPYAIFEPFGAQTSGKDTFGETEAFLLDNIAKVAEGQRTASCHFDIYSLEFWVDYHGDLTQADPKRFPQGFNNINPELKKLGTSLGLWIDSSWEHWSVGGNPAVQPTLSNDPAYGKQWMSLCRATEPVKSMYSNAFRYHVKENGVRMVKFDNFRPLCYNPSHEHLPGVYSMEAIGNAVIGTLRDLDAENPDVFLMLYWGYRSPWWLLHADTLFESGLAMEASSPGPSPTLYARDSVTVGLDQGQWYCNDVPRLGKDSLGVWLSDWSWNSSIGKERWQEGMVMDLCRGSLLAQPWSDCAWLSPPERRQMADFIALLKERPDCFGNSSLIQGNPWRNEPYGYVCSNGKRAFIALNNCTWKDVAVELQLNPAWGLPGEAAWDIYRWYPDPARLQHAGAAIEKTVPFSLRPFEVVLLEAVPVGTTPSLDRSFVAAPLPKTFTEPTRELTLGTTQTQKEFKVKGEVPPCQLGGTLVVTAEMRKGAVAVMTKDVGTHFTISGTLRGGPLECHPVLGKATYPASWQTWRIAVEASSNPQPFEFSIINSTELEAELSCRGHFLPR